MTVYLSKKKYFLLFFMVILFFTGGWLAFHSASEGICLFVHVISAIVLH